jgi:hypothetical protein
MHCKMALLLLLQRRRLQSVSVNAAAQSLQHSLCYYSAVAAGAQ